MDDNNKTNSYVSVLNAIHYKTLHKPCGVDELLRHSGNNLKIRGFDPVGITFNKLMAPSFKVDELIPRVIDLE